MGAWCASTARRQELPARKEHELAAERHMVSWMHSFWDSRLYYTVHVLQETWQCWSLVSVSGMGQLTISSWKVLHSQRPHYLEQVSLCQSLLWYRDIMPGQEDSNAWPQGAPKSLDLITSVAIPTHLLLVLPLEPSFSKMAQGR